MATPAEIREAVVLTAISASNLISGVQDEAEREHLEALFRDTFGREREIARLNQAFLAEWWRLDA